MRRASQPSLARHARARRRRTPAAATASRRRRRRRSSSRKNVHRRGRPQADRWGDVQVTIVVRKTTTTTGAKKKTVKRKITAVTVPVYPDHTDRSVFINQQALPILIQEALQAQSANIDMISGATDTSQAFIQSLQSAILKAKKA